MVEEARALLAAHDNDAEQLPLQAFAANDVLGQTDRSITDTLPFGAAPRR
jgi:hypothetical protein